ncbi:MAG: DUF6088 family protein [Agriterribacter sp.]
MTKNDSTITNNRLLDKIVQKGKGNLVFASDFHELGTNDAIRKGLSRLTKEKLLVRLGPGIYLFPEYDQELGVLYPSTEEIAEAIARQEKARIIPTGSQALYKLGLSTQIPMKAVYLTDGMRRTIKLGKRIITFKITTPRKLATKGKISSLVIQALQELGKDQVDNEVISQIKKILVKEDPQLIRHDAKLAPVWIASLLFTLFKELKHDRMAETNG